MKLSNLHQNPESSPSFSSIPAKFIEAASCNMATTVQKLTEAPRTAMATTSTNFKPTILACSPKARFLLSQRNLLDDRKQTFEHLKPRPFLFSTVRVAIIQGGQVMTTFMTDQLEYESANEELIVQGKITPMEADEMNEQWETTEWNERWKKFPKRFLHAFVKLQSAIVFMRIYEKMAERLFTTETLDKLTKDPFKSSKRKSQQYEYSQHKRYMIASKMFSTCLWANAISCLSDYTVQQLLLVTGHFMYYRKKRLAIQNRRYEIKKEEDKKEIEGSKDGDTSDDEDDEEEEEEDSKRDIGAGGIGLSLAFKSSSLLLSRGTSWVVSSGTGAIGSAIYPGWGTLFGTQLGDGIVGALIE